MCFRVCSLLYMISCIIWFAAVTTNANPGLEALAAWPTPVVYKNGPGKCATNLVKCKKIAVDWCAHFCLHVYEGWLMLNVTFTIWAMQSDEMWYELGAIESDANSEQSPPQMTGNWFLNGTQTDANRIEIEHFRYPTDEAMHFFRFEINPGSGDKYDGNIMNYDFDNLRFELHCFQLGPFGVRGDQSVLGWMDLEGTKIEWEKKDIYGNEIDEKDVLFAGRTFTWDKFKLPRARGCFNYGPLEYFSQHSYDLSAACGAEPELGSYDGEKVTFTLEEEAILEQHLLEGESPCPACDQRVAHKAYYACSKRFESMKAEANKCQQLTRFTGIPMLSAVCKARVQICMTIQSAHFSPSKIEICPRPVFRFINDDPTEGFVGMSEQEIPDANPVLFGCIQFPVNHGMVRDLASIQRGKFAEAGKAPKIAWYIRYWPTARLVLFTSLALWLVRWLFKLPKDSAFDDDEDSFDDAKFFQEYGEFYSDTETDDDEEEDEYELYDKMFG